MFRDTGLGIRVWGLGEYEQPSDFRALDRPVAAQEFAVS